MTAEQRVKQLEDVLRSINSTLRATPRPSPASDGCAQYQPLVTATLNIMGLTDVVLWESNDEYWRRLKVVR